MKMKKALLAALMCMTAAMATAQLDIDTGVFFPEAIASAFVDSSNGVADRAMVEVVSQGLGVAMLVFPLVGFQIIADRKSVV